MSQDDNSRQECQEEILRALSHRMKYDGDFGSTRRFFSSSVQCMQDLLYQNTPVFPPGSTVSVLGKSFVVSQKNYYLHGKPTIFTPEFSRTKQDSMEITFVRTGMIRERMQNAFSFVQDSITSTIEYYQNRYFTPPIKISNEKND
jgi:hypothetical protein